MDILLGLILMIAVIIFGAILLLKSINDRYPIIAFDVRDRGLLIQQNFREYGKLIVKDDLIGILLGNYKIYGVNKEAYEYVRLPNGRKIYQAVIRYDFLLTIEYDEKNKKELETRPVITISKEVANKMVGKDLKLLWDPQMILNDGILNPLKTQYSNEFLTEKSILVPKEIASRFIDHIKSNSKFNDASNPVMAVLISALPLGIVVLLTCILVYVVMMGFNSSAVEMLKTSQEIITLLKSRGV